ncbi:transposase [Enterococcus sp. OL5]|nr:IS110 family transposase [Enterococcus sp. OL5]
MTGVDISLGLQLIAEIGDVRRFSNRGALTAFAGLDPGC